MPITKMSIRTTFISFLECEVRGFWEKIEIPNPELSLIRQPVNLPSEIGWSSYKSLHEGIESEIALVRADGVRCRYAFKRNSTVTIGHNMVRFDQDDVIDEISVDEEEKAGKPPDRKFRNALCLDEENSL